MTKATTGPPTHVHHPVFARIYAHLAARMTTGEQRRHREELLAGLAGRVVEAGAGSGVNFAFYPPEVTHVLAAEPEPYLRHLATAQARHAPVPVEVVDAEASRLPLDSGSCDAAVASLMLCSVDDQAAALTEMRRVLRDGGELRFYEHVVARRGAGAALQRGLDLTIWPHVAGGCHMARDTEAAITAAGFRIEEIHRFSFGGMPHILGRAVTRG